MGRPLGGTVRRCDPLRGLDVAHENAHLIGHEPAQLIRVSASWFRPGPASLIVFTFGAALGGPSSSIVPGGNCTTNRDSALPPRPGDKITTRLSAPTAIFTASALSANPVHSGSVTQRAVVRVRSHRFARFSAKVRRSFANASGDHLPTATSKAILGGTENSPLPPPPVYPPP